MSEIRSQATPARGEDKRETLTRLGMIHLSERYGTRLRLEPSHDNEIRVDITHSGGTESHFPDALDLLESVEAVAEHMGLRKPRTVNSIEELEALPIGSVLARNIDDPDDMDVYVKRSDLAGYRYLPTPLTVLFTPGDAG